MTFWQRDVGAKSANKMLIKLTNRILADHVSVVSRSQEESSLVVVREPKLFETLTSIYLDKMLSVVPSFAICASSLAHQVRDSP